MILEISVIIPVLIVLVFLIIMKKFYKEQLNSYIFILVLVFSFFLPVIITSIIKSKSITDTEYWGDIVKQLEYEEEWDEWINQTCSREVCTGSGKDQSCQTEFYDCSYRDEHPERFTAIGYEFKKSISREEYELTLKKWKQGYKTEFVDMNRDFYTKDGDKFNYYWDKNNLNTQQLTLTRSYKNKLLLDNNLYTFEEVSKEDKERFKLYDYPEVRGLNQKTLLGFNNDKLQTKLDLYNGVYGPKKQVRVFILRFDNKESVQYQRRYWKGGNKNELVICVGSKDGLKLDWFETFSWSKETKCEIGLKNWIAGGDRTLEELMSILPTYIIDWKRREFKEFDYLQVYLSKNQQNVTALVTILLSIGLTFIAIRVVNQK